MNHVYIMIQYEQQTLEFIVGPLRLVLVFPVMNITGIRLAPLTGRNETKIGRVGGSGVNLIYK